MSADTAAKVTVDVFSRSLPSKKKVTMKVDSSKFRAILKTLQLDGDVYYRNQRVDGSATPALLGIAPGQTIQVEVVPEGDDPIGIAAIVARDREKREGDGLAAAVPGRKPSGHAPSHDAAGSDTAMSDVGASQSAAQRSPASSVGGNAGEPGTPLSAPSHSSHAVDTGDANARTRGKLPPPPVPQTSSTTATAPTSSASPTRAPPPKLSPKVLLGKKIVPPPFPGKARAAAPPSSSPQLSRPEDAVEARGSGREELGGGFAAPAAATTADSELPRDSADRPGDSDDAAKEKHLQATSQPRPSEDRADVNVQPRSQSSRRLSPTMDAVRAAPQLPVDGATGESPPFQHTRVPAAPAQTPPAAAAAAPPPPGVHREEEEEEERREATHASATVRPAVDERRSSNSDMPTVAEEMCSRGRSAPSPRAPTPTAAPAALRASFPSPKRLDQPGPVTPAAASEREQRREEEDVTMAGRGRRVEQEPEPKPEREEIRGTETPRYTVGFMHQGIRHQPQQFHDESLPPNAARGPQRGAAPARRAPVHHHTAQEPALHPWPSETPIPKLLAELSPPRNSLQESTAPFSASTRERRPAAWPNAVGGDALALLTSPPHPRLHSRHPAAAAHQRAPSSERMSHRQQSQQQQQQQQQQSFASRSVAGAGAQMVETCVQTEGEASLGLSSNEHGRNNGQGCPTSAASQPPSVFQVAAAAGDGGDGGGGGIGGTTPEFGRLERELQLLKRELAAERATREELSMQLHQTVTLLSVQAQQGHRLDEEDRLVREHQLMMERLREQRHSVRSRSRDLGADDDSNKKNKDRSFGDVAGGRRHPANINSSTTLLSSDATLLDATPIAPHGLREAPLERPSGFMATPPARRVVPSAW